MTTLAHNFVRPLLREQAEAVRSGAERVARSPDAAHVDPEAIHDYRVALRRLRTVLAAARPLFKRRPLARVEDGLKRFARTAGAVRDEEVLAETLAAIDLPTSTRARVQAWLLARARRERALRAAVIAQLTRPEPAPPEAAPPEAAPAASAPSEPEGLEPAALSLRDVLTLAETLPLRRRAASISTRSLATDALDAAARRVLCAAARPDAGSPGGLHRLRIRYKGVRYAGELLSGAIAKSGPLAAALATRVKVATRMQKRLGELHDLDEAIARVARARVLGPGDRMVVHHGLRTRRAALLERLERELPAALSLLAQHVGGGVTASSK